MVLVSNKSLCKSCVTETLEVNMPVRREYPRNGSDPSLASLVNSDSPLKLFVLAKRQINDTFKSIHGYVEESRSFLETQKHVLSESKIVEVVEMSNTVSGIRDVLARDIMKVAFFGRTSNGKSTVINAVLRNKILPSGMGHTTNCFLQVEGTDSKEAHLTIQEDDNMTWDHPDGSCVSKKPPTKHAVESVSHLANALTSDRMGDSTLVRIFWPKSKCTLLRDDVVLMDSPGIDVSANIDEWIDKHCLDADVFILVSNAESTLMRTEKAFFHRVSQKLSRPNIFVLNNRWDAIASEPENADLVRKQHTDRDVAFLCEELSTAVSNEEAQNRVFFVSAKEVLQYRLMTSDSATETPPAFANGFEDRLREFEDFERKFEECLSQSAVRTKFDQHTKRGRKILQTVKNILNEAYLLSEESMKEKQRQRRDLHERLLSTQQEMHVITSEIKEFIKTLVQEVEGKVCSALTEEIRRLNILVNDYDKPFSPEAHALASYKKELHSHVERGLGMNLRARLSAALSGHVEAASKHMEGRVLKGIGNARPLPPDIRGRSNFEVFYRLNCESLCADFQEDLEFRFSLGLISLIKRFSNRSPFRKEAVPRPLTAPSPVADGQLISSTLTDNESLLLMMIERSAIIAPHTHNLGALALGGFMVKTIGWKIIGGICAIYALLYTYERMTWNNRTKEKAFKKQYVVHATRKLKLIIDLTSANCSHQIQQ